jgi:hypothetical protein
VLTGRNFSPCQFSPVRMDELKREAAALAGCRMAVIIEREFGRTALVATFADPRRFVRATTKLPCAKSPKRTPAMSGRSTSHLALHNGRAWYDATQVLGVGLPTVSH